jgi:hypothetical protein
VLYQVGSWMGIPVVLALCLYLYNLVRTMRAPARPAPAGAPRPAFASTLPVR